MAPASRPYRQTARNTVTTLHVCSAVLLALIHEHKCVRIA